MILERPSDASRRTTTAREFRPKPIENKITKQIRHAERVCSDEGCQSVHPDTDQDFYTWPATQAALYVLPQADGGRTHHVTVKNLFSLTSVADGINVRSSGQVTFEDIFVANSGDDALALWAGAGLGDLWFKGAFGRKTWELWARSSNRLSKYLYAQREQKH